MGLRRSLEIHNISLCMLEYICWARLVSLDVGLVLEMSSSASQVCRIISANRPARGSIVNRAHFIEVSSMAGQPDTIYVLLAKPLDLAGSRPGRQDLGSLHSFLFPKLFFCK